MDYRLRIILTAFHELKKTNPLVSMRMVSEHTNIPKATIDTWLGGNLYNGRRLYLDHETTLMRHRVCEYVREHCGHKNPMTTWDLSIASRVSRATINNMIRDGQLKQKHIRNSKPKGFHRSRPVAFYIAREIKPVELPTDFEPLTISEHKKTQRPWNLPATFPESTRGKQVERQRKSTLEMDENDEQDDLTLSVYYAICRPSPYPEDSDIEFHGWTFKQISEASGRCETAVRSVVKYLESGKGRKCLVKKTLVGNTPHYKQRLISDVKEDIRMPGIRIISGKREHDRRAA